MTDVLEQHGPAQRLTNENIGWLTTVGRRSQPQSSPVWFIGEGASLWLRSQRNAGKVRNIAANPSVAFHLSDDGQGRNVVTIEGTASLEPELPPAVLDAYMAKYDEAIRTALGTSRSQLVADYPITIRIIPTRARVW